jgi:hypothetical protein
MHDVMDHPKNMKCMKVMGMIKHERHSSDACDDQRHLLT